MNMRFNANSLGVLFTTKSVVGVALMPNIVFKDKNREYDYAWTLLGQFNLGTSPLLGM